MRTGRSRDDTPPVCYYSSHFRYAYASHPPVFMLTFCPSTDDPLPVFHPEFGRFMLEATPGKPWGIEFKELLGVEPNMKLR